MREHFTVHLTDDDTISPRLHTQCGEVAVVETGDWVESVELANFVALACNSHYALVEALEARNEPMKPCRGPRSVTDNCNHSRCFPGCPNYDPAQDQKAVMLRVLELIRQQADNALATFATTATIFALEGIRDTARGAIIQIEAAPEPANPLLASLIETLYLAQRACSLTADTAERAIFERAHAAINAEKE